jgi:hypothetical protein
MREAHLTSGARGRHGQPSLTARPALVHAEVEVLFDTLYQPLCENNAGRDAFADSDKPVQLTSRDEEVTCRKCLKALGYDVDRMAA